jgi:hypothetical protein
MTQRTAQNPTGIRELGQPNPNRIVAEYDFAIDGGLVGDIALRGDTLPSGAVVTDVLIHVDTVLTGATATVAIKSEGAADLQSAAAISGAPWSTTGAKRATFTATTAPVKTTADRAITATVGTANLTAGRFRVVVEYYVMTA